MPLIKEVRACLLQVIAEQMPKRVGDSNLQSGSVLEETDRRLGRKRDPSLEEAILTVFHDLLRTGYLAWGYNLCNPNPPFFHVTERGRMSLATLSRDPMNPDGYLNFLSKNANLNPIADSYLKEALSCFVNDLPKAAAVMIGGAAESMALELRDKITERLNSLNCDIPKKMNDFRIKMVLDSIYLFFIHNAGQMSQDLQESFKSYWPAFSQQIRSMRNEAGHPSSFAPVTFYNVHASMLIFPELAKLTRQLIEWVSHYEK